MPPATLATYLVSVFLLTLAPGPDILTVISRSVSQGLPAGLAATFGFATGLVFHTALAATGLALLLQQTPWAFHSVQIIGILYLLYLTLQILRARQPLDVSPKDRRALKSIYVQSILMNILNPKVAGFFLAFFSGFINPAASAPVWQQTVILGAIFAAVTLLVFGTCAILARRLAALLPKSPATQNKLRYLTAGTFLLIALFLAKSLLFP